MTIIMVLSIDCRGDVSAIELIECVICVSRVRQLSSFAYTYFGNERKLSLINNCEFENSVKNEIQQDNQRNAINNSWQPSSRYEARGTNRMKRKCCSNDQLASFFFFIIRHKKRRGMKDSGQFAATQRKIILYICFFVLVFKCSS